MIRCRSSKPFSHPAQNLLNSLFIEYGLLTIGCNLAPGHSGLHLYSTAKHRPFRKVHHYRGLYGADSPIRTDVDFRLVVTNHVQSATMRYRHIRERKEFGEQFQSHASSMELHNLEYAQRTEVLVRRSWSSECSIGEAGIVFTWLLMLVYELIKSLLVISGMGWHIIGFTPFSYCIIRNTIMQTNLCKIALIT